MNQADFATVALMKFYQSVLSVCSLLVASLSTIAAERVATVRVPDVLGTPIREAMGTVIAEREQPLAFEWNGRLISPQREMGSHISAGEVVVALDDREARASVTLAEAGVARADADLMLQRSQHERLAENHAKQVISDADLDTARAALERARADRSRAVAERDIAQLRLEKHRLVAEFDAYLNQRTPPPGSYVTSGVSVGTLTDPARRVRMEVTSNELRMLHEALLTIRLRDDQTLSLIAASPIADPATGMHLVHLRVPDDTTGAPGELLALQLVDPNAFAHLDQVLREDAAGMHVLVVADGVTERLTWPPTDAGSLAGKAVVVIGGSMLSAGSTVDAVALEDLRQ